MNNKNTLLIVDDDKFDRKLLKKLLADSYEILEASNGKEALEVLHKHSINICGIVLDLVMPVMNGYEFLRFFSANPQYKDIPVLVLTSDDNYGGEKICLEFGAWDFIRKPFEEITLKLRLKNIIGRSQLSLLKQMEYMSEHDQLTGLFNRTKFFSETRRMLEEHKDTRFVFIRFDIERFHLINSFLSEEDGNKLLKFVADFFRKHSSELSCCTYGRIHSDVFCMCAPYDEVDLYKSADKVRKLLAEYNRSCYIEPTYGVYIIDDPGISIESMYERASMAAKKCKNKYMNCIEYYNRSMSEEQAYEQQVINEMQSALDNEQFEVYLQPKYVLKTNMPFGAEALVRWKHPQYGIISPGRFIPIFERNGFIGKLDYYMWERVCRLLRKWIDSGFQPDPISVNVSRANMYNPHLVEMLTELVKKYDISPSLLNLELTETSYMDNPNQMKKTVAELKSNGFVILMDDFGSGYSSLNTLKDIDVDILKIDMKFLPTGEGDSKSERILSSIVRMASWLELPVIVEGVETVEQKEFLQSIGCQYVQGFLYARPMPVEEYEKIMQKHEIKDPTAEKSTQGLARLASIWSASPNAEQIFRNIIQPIAVYEYANGHCEPLRFNKAFIELFGFEPAIESVDNRNGSHISHDDRVKLKDALEYAVEEQETAECEYQWQSENREAMWVRAKLQYVKSAGQSHMMFAVFTDITEQKKLEDELHRLKASPSGEKDARAKILIADDSAVSRKMLSRILKEHYNVLEAENGSQALRIMNEWKNEVAAVLLDIVMPEMDGKTFMKHKNSNPDTADIPVIIISSEKRKDIQLAALKMGAVDYLSKPFVPEILLRRVKNAIDSKAQFRRQFKTKAI